MQQKGNNHEIDEAWEYFVPDPEIAEIFAESARHAGALEGLQDGPRGDAEHFVPGVRFGRGNPNSCYTRLAPERPIGRPELEKRECSKCGELFQPDKSVRVFCSLACRPTRSMLAKIKCAGCNTEFKPKRGTQSYCSSKCGGKAGAPSGPTKQQLAAFAQAWSAGKSLEQIGSLFGISRKTVQRWRLLAGCSPRKVGNRSRIKG